MLLLYLYNNKRPCYIASIRCTFIYTHNYFSTALILIARENHSMLLLYLYNNKRSCYIASIRCVSINTHNYFYEALIFIDKENHPIQCNWSLRVLHRLSPVHCQYAPLIRYREVSIGITHTMACGVNSVVLYEPKYSWYINPRWYCIALLISSLCLVNVKLHQIYHVYWMFIWSTAAHVAWKV